MIVRFTKPRHDDRPPTLTVIRDDGTSTGQPSTPFFVAHDLTHYSVETVLGFKDAFYGLLGQGWDIDSFTERAPGSRKVRPLPEEALTAELIVGMLDMQRAQRTLADEDVVEQFQALAAERGLPATSLTADLVLAIRERRDSLLRRWSEAEAGETLELPFPG